MVKRLQEKLISGESHRVNNEDQQEGANQPSPFLRSSSVELSAAQQPLSGLISLGKARIKSKFQLPWDCNASAAASAAIQSEVTLTHQKEAEGGELAWAQAQGCSGQKGCLAEGGYEQVSCPEMLVTSIASPSSNPRAGAEPNSRQGPRLHMKVSSALFLTLSPPLTSLETSQRQGNVSIRQAHRPRSWEDTWCSVLGPQKVMPRSSPPFCLDYPDLLLLVFQQ